MIFFLTRKIMLGEGNKLVLVVERVVQNPGFGYCRAMPGFSSFFRQILAIFYHIINYMMVLAYK